MSEETVDKDLVIAGLIESNDILQGEVATLRSTTKLLRKVNSVLRGSVASLKNQIAIAMENDERFKQLCSGEFDAIGTDGADGGLPEPLSTAEPTV
jgi:hypothetical protein